MPVSLLLLRRNAKRARFACHVLLDFWVLKIDAKNKSTASSERYRAGRNNYITYSQNVKLCNVTVTNSVGGNLCM